MTNPIITVNSPTAIPATSLPPEMVPPPVGEAVAFVAPPVVEGVVAPEEVAALSRVCPTLGSRALPFTIQPPGVDVGQAGGVILADAE